ncbi:phosphatase PAP2 family protein [Longimicrobium sp.]|uniref:phosphatase PAP2 family protein n=1 Tax=Longimicrobium sp. TaxID=2029185 RepID=UPI002C888515|nr:phosphatase PAP2 family protein [Longimicrobium sp.]HSU16503.1 phosphatase PAP2 family protein [Longimicrobium sp.]
MTNPDRSDDSGARRDAGRRALALAAVAAAGAVGFGVLNAAVARRKTARADREVLERTGAPDGSPVRRAAAALSPVGKWWTYIPAALGTSAWVLAAQRGDGEDERRSGAAGAGAIFAAGVIATGLNHAFDAWLPQPPPPPGRKSRTKPVFPSGHAFGPAAVGLASAYVLAREGIASPYAALPIAAAIPAVTAGGRLLDEKHWASDVLGGYIGGIALAAACLAAYEAAGRR